MLRDFGRSDTLKSPGPRTNHTMNLTSAYDAPKSSLLTTTQARSVVVESRPAFAISTRDVLDAKPVPMLA
jgi:hypothetical protein